MEKGRTHPVHRGRGDPELRPGGVGPADQADRHGHVVVDQGVGGGRRVDRRPDGVEPVRHSGSDVVGDPPIGRRDDLGAVTPVDLDAVVLGGVVGGGDHHARGGVEMADAPGDQGCRLRARHQAARDAGGLEHGDDADRELLGPVAGVVADEYTSVGRPVGVGVERTSQARGRLAGHQEVEAIGARTHLASQARGTEVEAFAHQIGELDQVAGRPRPLERVDESGGGCRVGVGRDPGFGRSEQRTGVAHPRNPRRGRSGRWSQLSAG